MHTVVSVHGVHGRTELLLDRVRCRTAIGQGQVSAEFRSHALGLCRTATPLAEDLVGVNVVTRCMPLGEQHRLHCLFSLLSHPLGDHSKIELSAELRRGSQSLYAAETRRPVLLDEPLGLDEGLRPQHWYDLVHNPETQGLGEGPLVVRTGSPQCMYSLFS